MTTTDSRPGAADQVAAKRSMGTFELAFFVVAAAGPLLVVAGYAPLAIALGGTGAPLVQLIAGLVLMIFAVGFTRMAGRIKNAGAFYSFIGTSMGKPAGGGAALVAMAAYSAIAIGQLGAFSSFAMGTVNRLAGTDIRWWVFALIALVAIAWLGHRQISFSAKVLGVALLAEVAILFVLALPVVFQGGAEGLTLEPFNPGTAFAGGVGAMFTISFGAFIGFEATAVYSAEAKDPRKTVQRATVLAITFLTLFYAFMMWVIIIAFGQAGAVAVATEDPVNMFFVAMEQYAGPAPTLMMEILLITSAFASTLAFHSTATRYMATLGRDRLLPQKLQTLHGKHRSPWIANATQCAIALVSLTIFAVLGLDPYLQLFLWTSSPAILSIVVLQALCSVAVVIFFRRRVRSGISEPVWSTLVAPIAALVGLCIATVLIISNFDLLTSGTVGLNALLIGLVPAVFAIGAIRALWMRRNRPEQYEHLITTPVDG